MDAIIEGYNVLKGLGFEILPEEEYEDYTNKKKLCTFIYRFFIFKLSRKNMYIRSCDEC